MAKVQRALLFILTLLILTVCMGGQAWADLSIDWSKQHARMNAATIGAATAAASCSQSTLASQETQSVEFGLVRTGRNYCFSSFVASGNDTVRRVEIYLKKTGSPTSCSAGVIALCNMADSTTCGSTCTNFDATFDIATISSSYSWVGFNLSAGYAITNGTEYCIRMYCSSVESSGTDLTVWGNTSETNREIGYGTDGSTYTKTENTQWNMRVKRCTE